MKQLTWCWMSVGLILTLSCGIAASQARTDISGNYHVTGSSEKGPHYEGGLEIISHGEIYQFKWDVGDQYEGVGVLNGSTAAVAWTSGNDGSGCGVVSYQILANGKLDGIWGMWGMGDAGWEQATRFRGSGLAGQYNVSGENPDESPYKTTLSITAAGRSYEFKWGNNWSGYGIRQGNTVSVGFGGSQCAWVAYEIKPGGVLEGVWGGYGSLNMGAERAVKRK